MLRRSTVINLVLLLFPLSLAAQSPVNYDIVYVRAKRAGDTTRVSMPEVKDPIQMEGRKSWLWVAMELSSIR